MTTMVTATGGTVDLHELLSSHRNVDILDIAHHLAQINRYTGAASRPCSVAEHSIFVADILAKRGFSEEVQFAGLMHDAHEAYFGDVSTPLKDLLGYVFQQVEEAAAEQVRQRFHLRRTFELHGREIKNADLTALSTERLALMPDAGPPWPVVTSHPPVDWYDFDAQAEMTWKDWRDIFLQRVDELRPPY